MSTKITVDLKKKDPLNFFEDEIKRGLFFVGPYGDLNIVTEVLSQMLPDKEGRELADQIAESFNLDLDLLDYVHYINLSNHSEQHAVSKKEFIENVDSGAWKVLESLEITNLKFIEA